MAQQHDQALEAAAEVYRRLLRQRRQARAFAGWVGTEENLAERERRTRLELDEVEQRYLLMPE